MMLWEVAYGVCHEALCLDSLEDFNATEADLMGLKNDILTMWDSRDRHRTWDPLGPCSHPHLLAPVRKVPPWVKPLLLQGLSVSSWCPSRSWLWPG